MAQLVIGIGSSHTPMLVSDSALWARRALDDMRAEHLYDTEGQLCSYTELASKVQDRYAEHATLENFNRKATAAQNALDRLKSDLAQTNPDVVIIVGDDQQELFTPANTPAISIFYGEKIITHYIEAEEYPGMDEDFLSAMQKGYRMDDRYELEGYAAFARELIERLVELGFDIGAMGELLDGDKTGFGHAYGFIYNRLMGEKKFPIIPVMLNTFYPPNQPTPARCYDLGRALRTAIEASPSKLRVGIVASGGLSHFVTNEELDWKILAALQERNGEALRKLPARLLQSGSSEIRNWIAVAGAVEGMELNWYEYHPVYRTPAGTGVGMAFARWS